ncbi:uncharacterized protein BX663DRAFT_494047 [Cokeromyces recurvatus]|uniref:uncharacterized protein n=1 Tax=Cokeromyces recurvatus TaxID=90255 RepID=UPI00221E622D|nr:uncharacterized protein BX663DRAFT_494047 [Cokeromyces recurvatus]KAI7906871.1 hypothetical protein BX663DRAFT_494047 [Cokeromyces recurvatus]
MDEKNQKTIVVIGAGVTGLTTAVSLMEKGYKKVLIVAKHLPGDLSIEYTSPYAGAHWRTMAKNDDQLLQRFDTISYKKFIQLAENNEKESTGIMIVPSFDYYDDDSIIENTDPWFKDVVQNFQLLTEKDNLPEGAKIGHTYTTVLVNTPVYLKWLLSKFKSFGGHLVRYSLSHIDEIFNFLHQQQPTEMNKDEQHFAVINCTGLGARFLGGVQDNALYPTRGQTVIIKASHIKKTITHVGKQKNINYIIPRSDGTVILGGTANEHDFNPFPDDTVTKSILEKTVNLCPELRTDHHQPLDIVRYAVGLRPTRLGGPRIENEILFSRDKRRSVQVTHAYGHGGFGVQASWGSAEYVIQVMEEKINKQELHLSKL